VWCGVWFKLATNELAVTTISEALLARICGIPTARPVTIIVIA